VERDAGQAPRPPDWDRRAREIVRKNVAAFRAYNDRRAGAEAACTGTAERVPLVCECGDAHCWDAIELTLAELEAARGSPNTYAVKPLHIMPDHEHVIARRDRYWVVEKVMPESARRRAPGHAGSHAPAAD
jgi:hypothetical protein